MTERTKARARRHTATPRPNNDASPTYIQLAGDAVLSGMTREQAIAGLISRIKRDQGYLAYRKACNRRTSYDDQVTSDIRALALAAVLLGAEDLGGPSGRRAHSATRDQDRHGPEEQRRPGPDEASVPGVESRNAGGH